jgi:hypothetical protein
MSRLRVIGGRLFGMKYLDKYGARACSHDWPGPRRELFARQPRKSE